MNTGTVKRFNKIKGYGFITPDDSDTEVFVHFSEVQIAGYKELQVGQRISYELTKGDRGEFATKVKIL
jgi:CspA family cold shock protein